MLASDLDIGLGEGGSCTLTNWPLFANYDQSLMRLEATPSFLRAYWRGIQDAVNGPMLSANVDPVLDGNYAALLGNGVAVTSPDDISTTVCTDGPTLRTWIQLRRSFLTGELGKVTAPFEISNNNGDNFSVTNQSSLTLFGKAPVEVASIQSKRINGTNSLVVQIGLTNWTSVTNWSMPMALPSGTNRFEVTGFNRLGFSNAFDSITVRSW